VNEVITRRVRAYFAPVDRATGTPTLFDAAQTGGFPLDTPPAPWINLGWCTNFKRTSGAATALRSGAPAMAYAQIRAESEATVQFELATWGKLQLALTSGSQQMNLLADAATALQTGSTAIALQPGDAAATFNIGDYIAVDQDYTGQTGFVGAGVSGAYVRSTADVNNDADYIRRISLNVGRVASIANGALQLETPLIAGVPSAEMKVSRVAGFVDREGSSFFQEWSALFVMEGEQGDRVIVHYPRLQAMHGAAETAETLSAPLERMRLAGAFRALPVRDAIDGEMVLCFRSYLPA
jgi:hypothetical protein